MPKLTDRPLTDVLAAFRSSDPTPGGGSASALAGALGASLVGMVAALPKPSAATDEDLKRLHAAGARCSVLAEQMTALVDADSDAYDAVTAAYRLPKSSDDEKSKRSAAIQQALRGAIEVPLDVMRACRSTLEQAAIAAELGNRSASSDVQVAVELVTAGLRGARFNVEINLASVKDAEYASKVADETSRLTAEAETKAAAVRNLARP